MLLSDSSSDSDGLSDDEDANMILDDSNLRAAAAVVSKVMLPVVATAAGWLTTSVLAQPAQQQIVPVNGQGQYVHALGSTVAHIDSLIRMGNPPLLPFNLLTSIPELFNDLVTDTVQWKNLFKLVEPVLEVPYDESENFFEDPFVGNGAPPRYQPETTADIRARMSMTGRPRIAGTPMACFINFWRYMRGFSSNRDNLHTVSSTSTVRRMVRTYGMWVPTHAHPGLVCLPPQWYFAHAV